MQERCFTATVVTEQANSLAFAQGKACSQKDRRGHVGLHIAKMNVLQFDDGWRDKRCCGRDIDGHGVGPF